jgi:hypothetical protein
MKVFWKDCMGKKKNYFGNESSGFLARRNFFEKIFSYLSNFVIADRY